MSVWPDTIPCTPTLSTSEGELECVRVAVDPRLLEELLEALAQLSFPINPQIRHLPASAPDVAGERERKPAALVEFPAYAGRLEEIRSTLERHGFGAESVDVIRMLDDLHAKQRPGAPAKPML